MSAQTDIDELLTKCQQGDDAAHAEFYNRYHPYINRVVAKQLKQLNVYHDKNDVDDLTNDIVLKFSTDSYKSFENIRSLSSINGWLYVLVKNFVLSYVRSQVRKDHLQKQYVAESEQSIPDEPGEVFLHNEQKEMVMDSLKTLDKQERLVVTMYYIDHLKYYEIADVLNLNINTVATKLKRAKEKLYTALRRHHDEF